MLISNITSFSRRAIARKQPAQVRTAICCNVLITYCQRPTFIWYALPRDSAKTTSGHFLFAYARNRTNTLHYNVFPPKFASHEFNDDEFLRLSGKRAEIFSRNQLIREYLHCGPIMERVEVRVRIARTSNGIE